MKRILWLAYHTTTEILRQRILYTAVFFAVVLIGVGAALGTAAPGQKGVVVVDVGLGAINLFGVLITIVMGVNLLYQELERKTVYNILAKPISRAEFVLGKYFGLLGAVVIVVAVMSVIFALAVVSSGGGLSALVWQAIAMTILEFALLGAVAMVFSAFSTPYMSGLFTLGIWVLGSMAEDAANWVFLAKSEIAQGILKIAFWVIPSFTKFNLRDRVPYALVPPDGYFPVTISYGVIYAAALLLIAIVIFYRRDFK